MSVTRPSFTVYLADSSTEEGHVEHVVTVSYADQLRAEFEAKKQGMPAISDAPQNHTSVWIWCALVRAGHYAGPYQQLAQVDLLDVKPVRDLEGDPVGESPDPTRAAGSTPSA